MRKMNADLYIITEKDGFVNEKVTKFFVSKRDFEEKAAFSFTIKASHVLFIGHGTPYNVIKEVEKGFEL